MGRQSSMMGPRIVVIALAAGALVLVAKMGFLGDVHLPSFSSGPAAVAPKAGDGPAILAAAKKHDGESYVWAGGHPPKAFKPGNGLDCSGLVNVAVLEATGVNEDRLAENFMGSKHWSKISFADAGPGDIMYRLKAEKGGDFDHVVIVDTNGGDGKLNVFEAWSSHVAQKEQVRVTHAQSYSSFSGALRFHR